MTLTVEKLLVDAKQLVERLQEKDSAAEGLLSQAESVNQRIQSMKQVNCVIG